MIHGDIKIANLFLFIDRCSLIMYIYITHVKTVWSVSNFQQHSRLRIWSIWVQVALHRMDIWDKKHISIMEISTRKGTDYIYVTWE